MDSNIEKLIVDLASELSIEVEIVKECMKTASICLREQMKVMEYPSILWPRFGTFTLNPNRMSDGEEKECYKEFKADFKKKPYRGIKRHSPINKTVEVHNEQILDKIIKGLNEIELIQNSK